MGCTCHGTGPGIVLIGGDGVEVTGAGTSMSPFRIESETLGAPIIEVRDSATVNMSITGSGSEADPYLIRADTGSAASLSALADVISDPPQPGAVPTWVAAAGNVPAHWEFQVPVIVTQPAQGGGGGGTTPTPITSVATSILTGTLMDQTLPARLQKTTALLPQGYNLNDATDTGFFRGYGISNAPDGNWYYFELISHDGSYQYQRASRYFAPYDTYERRKDGNAWKPWRKLAYEDSLLTTGLLDGRYAAKNVSDIATGSGTAASGWSVNRFILKKVNHVVSLDISLTRTGPKIPGSATGNITNVLMGNVGSWRPLTPWAPLSSGPGGINNAYAVNGNGDLYLTALAPGIDGNSNYEYTVGGSYVTAS